MKKWMMVICIAGLFFVLSFPALGEQGYTLSLHGAMPIYQGPGYDYGYLQPVGEDGVYTIVEEWEDKEGYLWGRLKSGVGWVNLTLAREDFWQECPLTASFADAQLLSDGGYHQILTEAPTEYMVKIVLRPQEALSNVQLSLLEWGEDGYRAAATYCTLYCLTPDIPLVAGVVFYGDMTTYGVSFQDEAGMERCYALSISGRDGSLVVEETACNR